MFSKLIILLFFIFFVKNDYYRNFQSTSEKYFSHSFRGIIKAFKIVLVLFIRCNIFQKNWKALYPNKIIHLTFFLIQGYIYNKISIQRINYIFLESQKLIKMVPPYKNLSKYFFKAKAQDLYFAGLQIEFYYFCQK